MRKIWDIPGGIHPAENKSQSLQQAIGTLPMPEYLILPLSQHLGAPAKPVIKAGDRVLKGQLIAEPQGFISAAIHAPTSGIIEAIEGHSVPHPSGMTARCIKLKPDGRDEWIQHQGIENYQAVPPEELLTRVRESGIIGLGGAGFPSSVKLGPKQAIDTLIINGTECEPYITADDILMQERASEIIEGVRILAYILHNPDNIVIGIEDNKPRAFELLSTAAKDTSIEVVEFPTKYPSGGEKQLIQILTGKEVPSGKLPADLGVLCQNVGTTYAIYRAIVHGEPLISRITTVTGEGCKTNGNYEVLIGTPVKALLTANIADDKQPPKLIMGGPMMGFAIDNTDIPVVKTSNCIIAASSDEMPPAPIAQPCIRCGLCAQACPASLLPQQLLWHSQAQNYDHLEAHNLFDCIECGACAYVCPSSIPLVQYYRSTKSEIRKLAVEKQKSDHARQRFEFHQTRIEKIETEKTAKREARRKAAQEAHKKVAGSGEKTSSADDIIQAALARTAARKASPEQQQAKLERGLESARNRLSAHQAKLAEAIDTEAGEEHIKKLQVKVDEAKLKLDDAERKLQDFKPEALDKTLENITTKIQASPQQQLQTKIDSLNQRITTTEQKIAETEDEKTRSALQGGLQKQQQKLADAKQQLIDLGDNGNDPVTDKPAMDAASAAIAKAQARAKAQSDMTPLQKLEKALEGLQTRITKAKQKLASAEAVQSEHIEVLRTALEKLETKYQLSQQEHQQLINKEGAQ